jgi:hypothetical protein
MLNEFRSWTTSSVGVQALACAGVLLHRYGIGLPMGNKLKLELQRSFSFPGPHFCGMMELNYGQTP